MSASKTQESPKSIFANKRHLNQPSESAAQYLGVQQLTSKGSLLTGFGPMDNIFTTQGVDVLNESIKNNDKMHGKNSQLSLQDLAAMDGMQRQQVMHQRPKSSEVYKPR